VTSQRNDVEYSNLFRSLCRRFRGSGEQYTGQMFTLGRDTLIQTEDATVYSGVWLDEGGRLVNVVAAMIWNLPAVRFLQGTEEEFLGRMRFLGIEHAPEVATP
jgi:hypothetical protein